MGYYNYHGIAQSLIKTGHCKKAELFLEYHNISPALVLFFDNHTPMPIREHKFFLYYDLLSQYNIEITEFE